MATQRPATPPDLAQDDRRAPPRFTPRWQRTPAGPVTIALLRQLHPARLVLPAGERLGHRDWRRHGEQGRDFILVATRATGGDREVLGTLELSLRDGDGDGPCLGMIDRLFVRPGQRQRGIGTQLVRSAIAFARDNGIATLREFIPNLLTLDDDTEDAHWALYAPVGQELGGVRSLGATAKACALEHQPCLVAGATRESSPHGGRDGGRSARIGGMLELPIAPPPGPGAPELAVDAVLARLLAELAGLAGAGTPAVAGVGA